MLTLSLSNQKTMLALTHMKNSSLAPSLSTIRNFEESEDELREEVADSMKNLFIMDEDEDEEPGEREEIDGRIKKEGGEDKGCGDPRPTQAEPDSYPLTKAPPSSTEAQDEGCGGQPEHIGDPQTSDEASSEDDGK